MLKPNSVLLFFLFMETCFGAFMFIFIIFCTFCVSIFFFVLSSGKGKVSEESRSKGSSLKVKDMGLIFNFKAGK